MYSMHYPINQCDGLLSILGIKLSTKYVICHHYLKETESIYYLRGICNLSDTHFSRGGIIVVN